MRVNHSGNGPIQSGDATESKHTETRHAEKNNSANSARQVERGSAGHESTRTSHTGASAEISSRSKDLAHAKTVATATPDVREDRIADLKNRISQGEYNIDSDAIADRMVDDHLRMSGTMRR